MKNVKPATREGHLRGGDERGGSTLSTLPAGHISFLKAFRFLPVGNKINYTLKLILCPLLKTFILTAQKKVFNEFDFTGADLDLNGLWKSQFKRISRFENKNLYLFF